MTDIYDSWSGPGRPVWVVFVYPSHPASTAKRIAVFEGVEETVVVQLTHGLPGEVPYASYHVVRNERVCSTEAEAEERAAALRRARDEAEPQVGDLVAVHTTTNLRWGVVTKRTPKAAEIMTSGRLDGAGAQSTPSGLPKRSPLTNITVISRAHQSVDSEGLEKISDK